MFPETLRFELGNYIDQFVWWLQVNLDWLFDVIKNGILKFYFLSSPFYCFYGGWLISCFLLDGGSSPGSLVCMQH